MTTAPGVLGVLQWIGIALAALGLSPAPWIAAMLAGKLVPFGWVKTQLDNRDAQIKTWQEAAAAQSVRADKAVEALATVANETGATAVHLLKSLPQASKGDADDAPQH